MSDSQVKSRKRVVDHGEVFTAKREVDAMLELVTNEMERIDSRVLEPACGNGNFLTEVLRRKLDVTERRYAKSQFEFERYSIVAISSVYGIDILEDNVNACQERLFSIFLERYDTLYKKKIDQQVLTVAKFILSKNIIWGDALSLKTVGATPQPIIFSEWSPMNHELMKRRDFTFSELMSEAEIKSLPLFSDVGEEVYIPTPIKEFSSTKFMKLNEVDE